MVFLIVGIALIGVWAVVVASPALASVFPGQNGKLVIAGSNLAGNGAFMETANGDGSAETQIASWAGGLSFGVTGRFSADGRRIVWVEPPGQIWTANSDGSGASQVSVSVMGASLGAGSSLSSAPSFTADGNIAFSASCCGPEGQQASVGIWVVPAGGGQAVKLPTGNNSDFQPTFSGNGTMAFMRVGTLMLANADGTGSHMVANVGPVLWGLDFSPDGSKIAYSTSGAGLLVVSSSGGSPSRLSGASGGPASFSPDGSKIAFVTQVPTSSSAPTPTPTVAANSAVDVIPSSGGTPTTIITKNYQQTGGTSLVGLDWQCVSCTAHPVSSPTGGILQQKIAEILMAGGYTRNVSVSKAGTLTITWVKGSGKHAKRTLVIAQGSKKFSKAGRGVMFIRLTKAGRTLLKSVGSRVKLTTVQVFKPKRGKTRTTRGAITLTR